MRRKDFIRNMSFIGAGLSLAPWNLATANSSIQRFRLPPASVHIPHGNFAANQLETLSISELDMECSVQHFMRNGIDKSTNDLIVYTFSKEDEILNLGFCQNTWSVDGEIEGLKLSTSSNKVVLRNADYELKLEVDSSEIALCKLN
jgi:hypothetical protein